VERNESLVATIKKLTKDKNFSIAHRNADILVGTPSTYPNPSYSDYSSNFWFNPNLKAEYFATDWNKLDDDQSNNPMRWVRAGGISQSNIGNATPLVSAGENGRAMIAFWDKIGLDENYNNGRLVVSYAITAWRDHHDGDRKDPQTGNYVQNRQGDAIVTRTTAALVQNLYDLMSGTTRYNITKKFENEETNVGGRGKLFITVRNPNTAPFSSFEEIFDTLHCRLKYIGPTKFSFINEDGSIANTTENAAVDIKTVGNRQRLAWTPDKEIPRRGNWVIEFTYEVNPPSACE
jgi:hypothetical protein